MSTIVARNNVTIKDLAYLGFIYMFAYWKMQKLKLGNLKSLYQIYTFITSTKSFGIKEQKNN